jgi:hypothetical protein
MTTLTPAVAPDDLILLICPNHPGKNWWTTPGSSVIHFHSETGKKNHHGLIPPFKQAVREIVSGKALKRDEPIEFTPAALKLVAEAYIAWEAEYAFECDCPTEQLTRR